VVLLQNRVTRPSRSASGEAALIISANNFDTKVTSPERLNQTKPFCSPQDQIQWGILFLSRHLRGFSLFKREEYLQDAWEWARRQGDLLCLQIIRDYRECRKESGPTFRRHQDWFLNNWNDPEFGGMQKTLLQIRVGESSRMHGGSEDHPYIPCLSQ